MKSRRRVDVGVDLFTGFLISTRVVAGVPLTLAWTGVIETSHQPDFPKRIMHVAIRCFFFVLIVHDPRTVDAARAEGIPPAHRPTDWPVTASGDPAGRGGVA